MLRGFALTRWRNARRILYAVSIDLCAIRFKLFVALSMHILFRSEPRLKISSQPIECWDVNQYTARRRLRFESYRPGNRTPGYIKTTLGFVSDDDFTSRHSYAKHSLSNRKGS